MAEFYGKTEDQIIESIENGQNFAEIAAELGVNRSMLCRWLSSDQHRSARSARAREFSAAAHEERAEGLISKANDPFELSRAKELAHHLRWRASKIAPRQYGDKLELAGNDDSPLTVVVRKFVESGKPDESEDAVSPPFNQRTSKDK